MRAMCRVHSSLIDWQEEDSGGGCSEYQILTVEIITLDTRPLPPGIVHLAPGSHSGQHKLSTHFSHLLLIPCKTLWRGNILSVEDTHCVETDSIWKYHLWPLLLTGMVGRDVKILPAVSSVRFEDWDLTCVTPQQIISLSSHFTPH